MEDFQVVAKYKDGDRITSSMTVSELIESLVNILPVKDVFVVAPTETGLTTKKIGEISVSFITHDGDKLDIVEPEPEPQMPEYVAPPEIPEPTSAEALAEIEEEGGWPELPGQGDNLETNGVEPEVKIKPLASKKKKRKAKSGLKPEHR